MSTSATAPVSPSLSPATAVEPLVVLSSISTSDETSLRLARSRCAGSPESVDESQERSTDMRRRTFDLRIAAVVIIGIIGSVHIATAQEIAKDREPGGAAMIGATATATVKAIDGANRVVTL